MCENNQTAEYENNESTRMLDDLWNLHQNGVLTEEEYLEKINYLLNGKKPMMNKKTLALAAAATTCVCAGALIGTAVLYCKLKKETKAYREVVKKGEQVKRRLYGKKNEVLSGIKSLYQKGTELFD